MTAAPRWTLAEIEISDLLGFQGTQKFTFGPGLQVIEAPNHTGKTSLALALLWGLTNQIPALARLDRKSFRLTNRHAGENAQPGVIIRLARPDGCRMEIRRRYSGRARKDEDIALSIGDEELSGPAADARILAELGLQPASLEGCGVVLQDYRLKLIVSPESEVSEVVNDMLGLVTLSELVPCLEKLALQAGQTSKEIEQYLAGADPLRRWEDEEARLAVALKQREDEALGAGFEPTAIQDSAGLIGGELRAVAESLETDAPAEGATAEREVERLRSVLSTKRATSPHTRELAELAARRERHQALSRGAEKIQDEWVQQDVFLAAEAQVGELDEAVIAKQIATMEGGLATNEQRREALEAEQELLKVAYQHLLRHPDSETCPVCQSSLPPAVLRERVKERLDATVAQELDRLAAADEELKKQKKQTEKRLKRVKELRGALDTLANRTKTLEAQFRELGLGADWRIDEAALFLEPARRTALAEGIGIARTKADEAVGKLADEEAVVQAKLSRQEEELYRPLDARLNRVRETLVPLRDATAELEEHGGLRNSAERKAGELEKLAKEARELAGRLKKIASAVSHEESARAEQAVRARLPFVSDFFARVAGNPDFTGLDIKTTVTRDKVAYRLRATSSRMAALGDDVGHVLSEGDLSAAGMALLLGLASGDSHNLGFLLLDDPAQGMDPTLQANFAREVAAIPDKRQVIILTHQPEFARALVERGAESKKLGRWDGGRLQGE